MLYTVKQDLDLCIEFKLSPAQLMFVKMLVPDLSLELPDRRKQNYAIAMKYQHELGGLHPDKLSDLISRDIIIDLNDYGKTLYEYYEINPKFAHKFALKVYPMVNELHDAYPAFFHNASGKQFIAKNCSPNEIGLEYLQAINNDPGEHKRVLEDVKWARENNAIVFGLKKFIGTRHWNAIRLLKTKKGNTKNNTDVTIL